MGVVRFGATRRRSLQLVIVAIFLAMFEERLKNFCEAAVRFPSAPGPFFKAREL
jgi:hypothetical protein